VASGRGSGRAEWGIVADQSNSPADPEQPAGRRRDARLIGSGVAAALFVTFAVRNLGRVKIEFWVHQSRAPLIVVIVISGLLGALITTLAHRYRSRRN
jgi:uncharacterized integral membrane protein